MNWRIRLANWLVRPLGMVVKQRWPNVYADVRDYHHCHRTAKDILAAKRKPRIDK